jgi:hypothetical protein
MFRIRVSRSVWKILHMLIFTFLCEFGKISGAGKISPELAKEVQAHIASNVTKPKQLASALQIRIAGCKGMLRFPDLPEDAPLHRMLKI